MCFFFFFQAEDGIRDAQESRGLGDVYKRQVEVYGSTDSRQRVAVVAFNIEGMDCGELSLRLEYDYGIITRSGLHCTPLAHQTLGTLVRGACRLSPGYFTTATDIHNVLQAVYNITHQS